MAKRSTSMKRSTPKRSKSTKTKRGGSLSKDLSRKIKNEFTNPKSLLRQQFYREAPLRNEYLQMARKIAPLSGSKEVVAATEALNQINEVAKTLGYGRKRKYVKYVKSKSHGKHGSKSK